MPLIDALIASQSGKRKTTKKAYYDPLYGEQSRASTAPATPKASPLAAPASGPSILNPPAVPNAPTPLTLQGGLPGYEPPKTLTDSLVGSLDGPAKIDAKQPGYGMDTVTGINVPLTGGNDYLNELNKMGGITGESSITTPNITYGRGTGNPAQVANQGQDAENRRIYSETSDLAAEAKKLGLLPEDAGYDFNKGSFKGTDIVNPSDLADSSTAQPGSNLAESILQALNPSLNRLGGRRVKQLATSGNTGEQFYIYSDTGERVPEGG